MWMPWTGSAPRSDLRSNSVALVRSAFYGQSATEIAEVEDIPVERPRAGSGSGCPGCAGSSREMRGRWNRLRGMQNVKHDATIWPAVRRSPTGQDRARVLSHLGTCTVCTAELEKYSGAADAMTALVPEAAPPEGFADRTLARVRAESKARATPLVRRLAAVAAVTVALALGAGVGGVAASSQGGSPATAFLSVPLYLTRGPRVGWCWCRQVRRAVGDDHP